MANKHRYDVGYRRPPRYTRFRKGESGNPSGRPKGSKNLTTVLAQTIEERVTYLEGGTRRTISKLEAAVKKLVDQATAGDARSMQQLFSLTQWVEGRSDALGAPEQPMTDADREVVATIYNQLKSSDAGDPQ